MSIMRHALNDHGPASAGSLESPVPAARSRRTSPPVCPPAASFYHQTAHHRPRLPPRSAPHVPPRHPSSRVTPRHPVTRHLVTPKGGVSVTETICSTRLLRLIDLHHSANFSTASPKVM